jgi:hypothetical protein
MTDPHIQMGRKLAAARDALGPTIAPRDLTRFDRVGRVNDEWSDFDADFKFWPLFCALALGAVIGLALYWAISTYIMGGL